MEYNQNKKDEYWIRLGKELCELVYTNTIINIIMSYSFGKSHNYTKTLELDFISLQLVLQKIIQLDYNNERDTIYYNDKAIPIKDIVHALKDDTPHINEQGQNEYYVVLLEQIKIKPKKYMKKITNTELDMIKQYIRDVTFFIDKLISMKELGNNQYGSTLNIVLHKIKKNIGLLDNIQENLSEECYLL
jgi:hypothetical protein